MKNITSLDYTKFVFAFCTVFQHTDFLGGKDTYIGYLFDQGLFRITVPFFFIASGYLFYNSLKNNTHTRWFKTYIKVYIVWSILYIPVLIRLYNSLKTGEPLDLGTKYLTLNMIFGFGHLWFFPALLTAGLLMMLASKLSGKVLVVMGIGLYVIGTLLQYRANYAHNISTDIGALSDPIWYRNGLFMGFPYFLTGYLINKYSVQFSSNIYFLLAVVALTLEASLNYSMGKGTSDLLFCAPFVTIMLFNNLLNTPSKQTNTAVLREHSKNIYLFQIYAIQIAFHFVSGWLMISMLSAALCFGYSYLRIKSNKVSITSLLDKVFSRRVASK
jgi:surface polysaccharide O-acyltransferase-like enzyme